MGTSVLAVEVSEAGLWGRRMAMETMGLLSPAGCLAERGGGERGLACCLLTTTQWR